MRLVIIIIIVVTTTGGDGCPICYDARLVQLMVMMLMMLLLMLKVIVRMMSCWLLLRLDIEGCRCQSQMFGRRWSTASSSNERFRNQSRRILIDGIS